MHMHCLAGSGDTTDGPVKSLSAKYLTHTHTMILRSTMMALLQYDSCKTLVISHHSHNRSELGKSPLYAWPYCLQQGDDVFSTFALFHLYVISSKHQGIQSYPLSLEQRRWWVVVSSCVFQRGVKDLPRRQCKLLRSLHWRHVEGYHRGPTSRLLGTTHSHQWTIRLVECGVLLWFRRLLHLCQLMHEQWLSQHGVLQWGNPLGSSISTHSIWVVFKVISRQQLRGYYTLCRSAQSTKTWLIRKANSLTTWRKTEALLFGQPNNHKTTNFS